MVRFGLFTFDPEAGELKKGDRVVKLHPQPAQLLALLVRRPGELVTRDQIRNALWGGETFVDYDLGINSAVRQVRMALGDDAEKPRYVQTVPRQGYRFIASLENEALAAPPVRKRRWPVLAAAVAVLFAGIAVELWSRRPAPETERAKPSVAVLLFDNVSGDESLHWLRTGLTEMLVTDLSQSPDLTVLSTDRLVKILEDEGHFDDEVTSEAVVRDVAKASGAGTVVVGSFMTSGETIRIHARVQDASNGEILRTAKVEGEGPSSLFSMVDELAEQVRESLSLPVVASDSFPSELAYYTTASIEAYRYYVEATRLLRRSKSLEALALYEKAIEEDPSWASAVMMVSMMHNNLGNEREAEDYGRRAVQLAKHLAPHRRYEAEGWYYAMREETYAKAIHAYEAMLEMDPEGVAMYHILARRYFLLERVPEAIERWERRRSQGADWMPLGQLASAYDHLERFDDAHRVIQEFIARFPDRSEGHAGLGEHFVRRGDLDAADEAFDKADALEPARMLSNRGRWQAAVLREAWHEAERLVSPFRNRRAGSARWEALRGLGVLELYRGRSEAALGLFDEATHAFGEPFRRGAASRIDGARVYLARGEPSPALELAELAEREGAGHYPEWEGLFYGALAHADLGRMDTALETADRLRRRTETMPTDKETRRHHHLLGELALRRSDPHRAVRELERAQAMLLPRGLFFPGRIPTHVPIWFSLAQAHLAAGNDADAFRWYTRIAESDNEHIWWPIPYVRSFYFLGRLCQKRGETAAAREHYRRFYELWKDGDLDSERVAEAKAKLKELR